MAQIHSSTLHLGISEEGWSITTPQSGQQLTFAEGPVVFSPVINDKPVELQLQTIQSRDNRVLIQYRAEDLLDCQLELRADPAEDAIDFRFQFRVRSACQLNRLNLFPKGARINMYDLVNPRNRHHIPMVWPEISLGAHDCQTDTTSRDWQFAPHPTMLLLRKNALSLLLACLDLPTSFGLHFAANRYVVSHCYLDYGDAPHGLALAEHEEFYSPWIRLFARSNRDPFRMWHEFGQMLIRSGRLPDPALRQRQSWWNEPLYCTWVDQCFEHDCMPPENLRDQAAAPSSAVTCLDENMVRRAAGVIKREQLPIRTILLDDGWMLTRGQWEPHPVRMPNFRALVDDLHAQGFKVAVWWNWAEVAADAQVPPHHLIAGGKFNRHGQRMRDYSLPATQNDYLKTAVLQTLLVRCRLLRSRRRQDRLPRRLSSPGNAHP